MALVGAQIAELERLAAANPAQAKQYRERWGYLRKICDAHTTRVIKEQDTDGHASPVAPTT